MAVDVGTGFIDVLPAVNPLAFNSALSKQVTPALSNLGGKVKSATGTLSTAIGSTLGVAVGVGAVAAIGRLTLGFEQAFTRIAALSNASSQDIARWRDQVLSLSGETAVAPQELADALFFLSSAGLEANQVFPALEQAAKASAVGLGTTADIANITASALNAYAESGLTAAQVTDTLVAAVREGRAEPEEFAEAMGRILPIASRAGVGFDEVAASLAGLSNIGLDVNEGVTSMRGLLGALVAPGTQAANTMRELGISTELMRETLAEGGLLAALQLLEERTGGNIDQLRKIIPNIRSLTGELGLTGENAAKVAQIFVAVENSTGALAKAFQETTDGPAFRFQQAMADIQRFAIRLGQIILPIASDIIDAFRLIVNPIISVLEILGRVPGVAQAAVFAFLSFRALTALPVIIGAVTAALGLNTAALTLNTTASVAAAVAQTGLSASQARGAVILDSTTAATTGFGASLSLLGGPVGIAVAGIALLTFGLAQAGETARKNAQSIKGYAELLAAGALDIEEVRKTFLADVPDVFRPKAQAALQQVINQWHALTAAEEREDAVIRASSEKLERTVLPRFGKAADLFAEMGTNAEQFANEASAAMTESDEAFAEFSAGAITDASSAIEDFRSDATDNLNFTADALSQLSSEAQSAADELASADLSTMEPADIRELREAADLTARELLESFRAAREETRAFGRDLLVISRTGGEAGERAAEVLLGMGEAGRAAAETIAEAGPKLREQLVSSFAAGEGAAENLATRLTRRIVGTLEVIKDILAAIADEWNIEIGDNTPKVKENIRGVHQQLMDLDGQQAVVDIVTRFTRIGAPPDVPGGQIAAGGIIQGQRGFITRGPMFHVGEGNYPTFAGKGAELVQPLDDRGIDIIAEAFSRAMERTGGQTIIVKVGEEELARVTTRGQRRRRSLVGA